MNVAIAKYIREYSPELQERMQTLHNIIVNEVDGLEERIAYGMPAYYYAGRPFVYFAGFRNHLGFYATPSVHEDPSLQEAMSSFKQGKGSIQFPNDKPLPVDLILKMLRLKQQQIQVKSKK